MAFHAPIAGQSVGRDSAVIQFLRGVRRMNPPHPHTVPPWDLPTVLRALKGPPVWTIAIHESHQSNFVKNHPAASTGVGQVSRKPAGPLHQPCLPGIGA